MKIFHAVNKKGFTIVEVLVMLAIIGVIVALLIPQILNFLTTAKVAAANAAASCYKVQMNGFLTECYIENKGRNILSGTGYLYAVVDGEGNHYIMPNSLGAGMDGTWTDFNSVKADLVSQLDKNISNVEYGSVLFVIKGNECIAVLFSPTGMAYGAGGLSDYVDENGKAQNMKNGLTMNDDIIIGFK